jgi:protein CpxP
MKLKTFSTIRHSLSLLCGAGILASFLVAPALAQEEAKPDKRPRAPAEAPDWSKMKSTLGLTDEQVAELQTFSKGQREKMQALRQDNSLSPEQKRERAAGLREEGKKEVEAVLTPEQQEKMNKMRGQMRERMEDRKEKRNEKKKGQDSDT